MKNIALLVEGHENGKGDTWMQGLYCYWECVYESGEELKCLSLFST